MQPRLGKEVKPTGQAKVLPSHHPELLLSILEPSRNCGVRLTSRGRCFLSATHTGAAVDRAVNAAIDAPEST